MAAMRDMMAQAEADGQRGRRRDVCRVPDESFDFLGYTFGRCYSPRTGRAYIGHDVRRRRRSQRLCRRDQRADRADDGCCLDAEEQVAQLNRMLRGLGELLLPRAGEPSLSGRGSAHVATGSVSGCVGSTRCRVGERHASPTSTCTEQLGLVRLDVRTRNFPWANSMSPCPRAGCGKSARPVR